MTESVQSEPKAANKGEPHWPASLAVVLALALYVTLPDRLILGPRWVLPVLELALLVPLTLHSPRRHHEEASWVRRVSVGLIALVNLANVANLALLAHYLVVGGHQSPDQGRQLIYSSFQIWLTNVLIFGLWYWELDRCGPTGRTRDPLPRPDFMFPQMANPDIAPPGWKPSFLDYSYTSFTNASAFSPTDTMPLTSIAKILMGIQSTASLLTVVLVAARAVNVLG